MWRACCSFHEQRGEIHTTRGPDAADGWEDTYPYLHAIETLRHLVTPGLVSVLSGGDLVFQLQKIERSGITAAYDRVLDLHA